MITERKNKESMQNGKENNQKNKTLDDLKRWRDFEQILQDLIIAPNHEDYRYVAYMLYKVSEKIADLEAIISALKEELKNKEAELYLKIKKEEQDKIEREYQEELKKIMEEEKIEVSDEGKKKAKKKKLPPKPRKTLPSKEIEMKVQIMLKKDREELSKYEAELKKKKNKYDAITRILKAVDNTLFYLNNNKADII